MAVYQSLAQKKGRENNTELECKIYAHIYVSVSVCANMRQEREASQRVSHLRLTIEVEAAGKLNKV